MVTQQLRKSCTCVVRVSAFFARVAATHVRWRRFRPPLSGSTFTQHRNACQAHAMSRCRACASAAAESLHSDKMCMMKTSPVRRAASCRPCLRLGESAPGRTREENHHAPHGMKLRAVRVDSKLASGCASQLAMRCTKQRQARIASRRPRQQGGMSAPMRVRHAACCWHAPSGAGSRSSRR